jgi:GH15 family glucan-1,4-alpha-glucosidase
MQSTQRELREAVKSPSAAHLGKLIEDYALIGDMHTAALVSKKGAIEWLCTPRFDSAAVFASLVGDQENGHWTVAPQDEPIAVKRRYLDGTLVLETDFETATGIVRLTDFMPIDGNEQCIDVVRIATGVRGQVAMNFEIRLRCGYGRILPWVRRHERGITAIAGPDAFNLYVPFPLVGKDWATTGAFTVGEGQTVPMVLNWHPSYDTAPPLLDAVKQYDDTVRWWRAWSSRCKAPEQWREPVVRSAITLKALTHLRTGGIIAAPTTSLPERIGGVRNWDYRYCWLRDAAFTLTALMSIGHTEEAEAWRQWLIRAIAGKPSELQVLYGVAGERTLEERELPWLSGFLGSRPVRVGNAAYTQWQLDVVGEVLDALYLARSNGLEHDDEAWHIERELVHHVTKTWREPGAGIWEQRSTPKRYVHSTVMAWVACDRAIKSVERFGLKGPAGDWKTVRSEIHDEVCRYGFSKQRNAFVQSFDTDALDASALLISMVGFLPWTDPRIIGTVEAIQRELVVDGFVCRYLPGDPNDGLPPGEGTFLACTFWLADNLAMLGRYTEARHLQRRRPVGRGIRPGEPAPARQLPTGVFPSRHHQHRLQPGARAGTGQGAC